MLPSHWDMQCCLCGCVSVVDGKCVRETVSASVVPARKCNLFFISTFAAAFHAKSKQIQHGKYVAYFTDCQQQLQQQQQQHKSSSSNSGNNNNSSGNN